MDKILQSVADTYLREVAGYQKHSLLTEASSLSALGATQKQIRQAHRERDIQLVANAEYETVKNKKLIMNVIQSSEGKEWLSWESIIGFDKEKNMYVAGSTGNGKWEIAKIDPEGEDLERWYETSPTKALSRIQGVKEYHVSRTGSKKKKHSMFSPSDRADALQYTIRQELLPTAIKYFEQEFNIVRQSIKTKMTTAIQSDDYELVYKLLSKLATGEDKGWYSDDIRSKNMNDFIRGNFNSNTIEKKLKDRFEAALKSKYGQGLFYRIEDELTYPEMKQLGYGVVLDMMKELKSRMGIK